MTVKTRLAVLFVMACLLTAAWLLLHTDQAHARPPVPPSVFKAVRANWKTRQERVEALDIAWCESRYSTQARNGQFLGAWQMGSWARAKYGHGRTAMAQARAAYLYYAECGWKGWSCA